MTTDGWRDLFDRAPCGLLSTDVDGTVTSVNDTFLRWTSRERHEVLGTYFMDHLSLGSQLFYETRFVPQLRNRSRVYEVALTLSRSDGSTLPVFVNAELDDHGTVHTAVFDATSRQDYERDLVAARRTAESSARRVHILAEAAAGFATAGTIEHLGETLVTAAEAATDASVVSVLLRDGDQLNTCAGHHALGTTFPLDAALPEAEAIRSGAPVLLSSAADVAALFPTEAAQVRRFKVEALHVFPLLEDGRAQAVLVCTFRRDRTLDESTLEVLATLTRQAAQVLQRIRLQQELEHRALHDSLTGLPNRAALRRRLRLLLASGTRRNRPVALMYIDLDGFKAINDSLGHPVGDDVLRTVSDRFLAGVRAEDTVGRLGGDEFVVLSEADEEFAAEIAERLRAAAAEPLPGKAAPFPLSASIGVALYDPTRSGEVTSERLVQLADEAMYRSKALGKNRTTVVIA